MKTLAGIFGKVWLWLKSAFVWTRTYAFKHKIISAIVVLIIIGGGYYAYTAYAASTTATQYVLATVTKAPLTVTVTESGTVDSQDTLSLVPQGGASGQITSVDVTPGEVVTAGQLIATIDATNAAEAVTSARQDLESAQISYEQTLTSSQTSTTDDQTSVTTAEQTAESNIASAYTNLATVMVGLNSTLHNIADIPNYNAFENIDAYEQLVNTSESHTYHDQVTASYATALASYQSALSAYNSADLNNLTPDQIEALDATTIQATQDVNQSLSDTLIYLNYVNAQLSASKQTVPAQLTTQISSLTSYQSTITSATQSVTSANTTLMNAEQTLTKDTQTLSAESGSTPLDVQSAELSVEKAQTALTQAETTEADYDIRAPFDGTIATVPVNKFDQASSGTTIATLITSEDYTDVSLNETDASKVLVGQPVAMTFDAVPNLTLNGTVAQIDPVGTVTDGVVTYDVKISFSQTDPRVKPGMTVNAVITTASEASAIQVPSSAITTTNGVSYVQVATLTNASSTLAAAGATGATGTHRMRSATSTAAYGGAGGAGSATSTGAFSTTTAAFAARVATARTLTVPESEVTIKKVPVVVGLSSDTMTEIVSGLQPGQFVVSSTISKSTTKTAAASATSLLGGSSTRTGAGFTGGGAGGGTYRAAGGGGAGVAGAGRGG